ncbi:MAG: radical SAM protein [Bacillota bacterium]
MTGPEGAAQAAIEWGARRYGVLPVTSVCDVRCVFCSNRQNPPGLKTYQLSPATIEQTVRTLGLMEDPQRIVVGESVTRIDEGEPFTHPAVLDLLALARERFPEAVLQVTTNGSLVTRERVRALAKLSPVEVILSLNSANEANRRRLMGDARPQRALAAADYLAEEGVPFQGSVVAMPHLVGWDDPARAALFLDERGAKLIRLFMPGFTRQAPSELRFPPSLWDDLARLVDQLAPSLRAPLLLEPPRLTDLEARLEGVVSDSPAARAGLRRGDVVVAVGGEEVFCRFDAHATATEAGPVEIEYQRAGDGRRKAVLHKRPDERPGFVTHYDINPVRLHRAAGLLHDGPRPALVFTSKLAEAVVRLALERVLESEALEGVRIVAVEDAFFGGSIMAAGLAVVQDYLAALTREEKAGRPVPRLILIPWEPWDQDRRDLTGRSVDEVAAAAGRAVIELV